MSTINIVTKLDIIQMQLEFYGHLLSRGSLERNIDGELNPAYLEKLTALNYWQDLYDKELNK